MDASTAFVMALAALGFGVVNLVVTLVAHRFTPAGLRSELQTLQLDFSEFVDKFVHAQKRESVRRMREAKEEAPAPVAVPELNDSAMNPSERGRALRQRLLRE